MTIQIKSAEFTFAADNFESLPQHKLNEVALIGRSNVGKSTLLNRLTQRRKLARTSNTPGRTQQLNFFKIKLSGSGNKKIQELFLVDLPGFGFAKLSKEKIYNLNRLTVDYLNAGPQLKLLCLLNDARRMPQEEELDLQKLAFEHDLRLLIILTKADKLSKSELANQRNKIARAYGLLAEDLFVTAEGMDCSELWQAILQNCQ